MTNWPNYDQITITLRPHYYQPTTNYDQITTDYDQTMTGCMWSKRGTAGKTFHSHLPSTGHSCISHTLSHQNSSRLLSQWRMRRSHTGSRHTAWQLRSVGRILGQRDIRATVTSLRSARQHEGCKKELNQVNWKNTQAWHDLRLMVFLTTVLHCIYIYIDQANEMNFLTLPVCRIDNSTYWYSATRTCCFI